MQRDQHAQTTNTTNTQDVTRYLGTRIKWANEQKLPDTSIIQTSNVRPVTRQLFVALNALCADNFAIHACRILYYLNLVLLNYRVLYEKYWSDR